MRQNTNKENYENIIHELNLDDLQKSILKSTWLDYLILMTKSANKGWMNHNYSQILIIILSLLIPVIEKTKLNLDLFGSNLSVISICSLIVAGLTTLNRQLSFEEKWRHYRRTAEAMRNEGDDYFALAGNYEGFTSHIECFKKFTTSVTSFKRQEVSNYMESIKNKKTNLQ